MTTGRPLSFPGVDEAHRELFARGAGDEVAEIVHTMTRASGESTTGEKLTAPSSIGAGFLTWSQSGTSIYVEIQLLSVSLTNHHKHVPRDYHSPIFIPV
jgi:hypothetical protein